MQINTFSLYSNIYKKRVLLLIIFSSIIKLILSNFIELGNDEVYYYTYALQPDWNHFDHPGMIGWMIRVTSFNLLWVSTFSLRIGSILCSAATTYIIFKCGTLARDEKAGYFASCIYTFSIYTSIIAGFFVMPDSPQLLFYSVSIYLIIKYVTNPNEFNTKKWILLGLFIGFATLSKVHALFLWFGFINYIFFFENKTLKNKNLYISIFITFICLIPIIYWNIQNDFITYKFHSKRILHSGVSFSNFMKEITGEFIYQNPFIFLIILATFFNIKSIKLSFNNKKVHTLLLWLGLPTILVFWVISLFNPTLPHWSGPGYVSLFIIAGVFLSNNNLKMPLLLNIAFVFDIFIIFSIITLINFVPFQFGSSKQRSIGEMNPLLDISGWSVFSNKFTKIVNYDISNGLMKKNSPIVIYKWFPGGHILFYVATPLHLNIISIGNLEDLHKFAWLNNHQQLHIGDDAYCIVPTNVPFDPLHDYQKYFEKILMPDTIPAIKNGILTRNFLIYRLKNCKKIPNKILNK